MEIKLKKDGSILIEINVINLQNFIKKTIFCLNVCNVVFYCIFKKIIKKIVNKPKEISKDE